MHVSSERWSTTSRIDANELARIADWFDDGASSRNDVGDAGYRSAPERIEGHRDPGPIRGVPGSARMRVAYRRALAGTEAEPSVDLEPCSPVPLVVDTIAS